MIRLLVALWVLCAVANLPAADPFISEFMASNQNSIADEDGSHPDWIEIRNPGPDPVDMNGWILRDSGKSWVFPTKVIEPGGHLIVFASDKDRRNPNSNLHTNFALSAGGEYLGLIKPDGFTVASEFAPYPTQYPDVSYGITVPVTEIVLLQKGSPARALVPTAANGGTTLGVSWRQMAFDDSAWQSGNLATGFFRLGSSPDLSADIGLNVEAPMYNINSSVYIRIPFSIGSASEIVQLKLQAQYDDGFAAFVNGNFVTSKNSPIEANLLPTSAATGSHIASLIEEVDLTSQISSLQDGANVLAIQGMNVAAGGGDFFVLPKLIAKVASNAPSETGYFASATPGGVNGGNEALLLPQQIVYSRPSGTFQSAFALTLSGALAGQEIRYNIANASTAGGTGANVPEPTPASTLYTGPINIDQSKIIRAAVFLAGGTQKGQTSTAQYLLLETGATNNTSNFTSNLPILVLSDHGFGEAVNSDTNTYTTAMLHLFEPFAGIASLNGPAANGVPNIFSRNGFRVRGSSSSGFPKKSYGMETWNEKNIDNDLPLLGMADDSDWILNGPYTYDDTYIHNAFIFEVSRRVGRWAPRTRFCEVFIDKNGGKLDYLDYNGIYVLTEKIKSNSERLDITGITPNEISGEGLTGGYIFKIDRVDGNEVRWRTTNGVPHGNSDEFVVLAEPDPDEDVTQQTDYIRNYVQQFDTAVYSEAASGFATRNYRNFIDVPSFVDHHILNSVAYNVDALRLSAFFFKDRGDKINAGPIWDFDRSLGSDDGRDVSPASWNNIAYFFDRDWWGRLFKDPDFVQAWVDRWWELRVAGGPLATPGLLEISNQMGNEIGNAAGARDAVKWPANAPDSGQVYLNEIAKMNTWLTQRLNWLDSLMPQPPTSSVASGLISPGTSVTLGGTGVMRYTLDGSDPRPGGGGIASPALTYGGPITINETTVITVRPQVTRTPFPNGAVSVNWGPPQTYVYLVDEAFAVAGDIAITELNYHPLGPSAAEVTAIPNVTASDFEFIELRNIGTRKVNTFEIRFAAGFPFERTLKLRPMSLNPGEFALVVKNRPAFLARYGGALASKIVGEWTYGSMSDGGEEIQLFARDGSPIQNFTYDDSGDWPGRADGKGSSLEYIGANVANATYAQPASWRSSSEFQGSPTLLGLGPDNRIVINEVLASSTSPLVDAIELKNQTASEISIGGWYLSDVGDPESPDDFKQFKIPAGATIGAGAYQVFTEVQFNPNGTWNPDAGTRDPEEFAFDGPRGDDAWVMETDSSGKITRFVDHVDFGASRNNETWGRWPDGAGMLYPMAQRTIFDEGSTTDPRPGSGGANGLPRVGPLVITEIHHTPDGGNLDLQFIEIVNPTFQSQSLNQWRLRGSVDFDFFTHSIEPAGKLVVVPFSPSDTAKVNAFRAAYGITGPLNLAGPWSSGDVLLSEGQVTLYRAEAPPADDPFYFPQTIEDETNYSNNGAWPDATLGMSLNRARSFGPGDASFAWTANIPTPGSVTNVVPTPVADSLHVVHSNGPVTLNVLPNDGDPDGDSLTITAVSSPSNGTVSTDGRLITYTSSIYATAPPNSSGEDSFSYTVSDGFGGEATTTVNLVNTRPMATPDSVHELLPASGPIVINPVANDFDAEGDAITLFDATSNSPASIGAVSVSNEVVQFFPGESYDGNASIAYVIRDASAGFATGIITLTNALPVANSDLIVVDGPSVNLNVTSNDTDGDSDPLSITSVGTATYGTVAHDGTSVTYTPGLAFFGEDAFTYSVADGRGGKASGTVLVRPGSLLTSSAAETGKEVPDTADGSIFKALQVPAIGADGQLAWVSTIAGPSGRRSMIIARRPSRMVARQGDSIAALGGAAVFTSFGTPVVDDVGRVVFVGTFSGPGISAKARNNSGIFASETDGSLTLIARLGAEPPGVPGGKFSKFTALDASDGEMLFVASLARNVGGVTSSNDVGIWAWNGSDAQLVIRTGTSAVTASGSKTISSLSLLNAVPVSPGHGRTHRLGRVAMLLSFTDKSTGLGIATVSETGWELVVPAITGTTWSSLGVPSLVGPAGVTAMVKLPSGVASKASDTAISLFGNGDPLEIAREGSATPIAGTTFKSFTDPVGAIEGEIAFTASLAGAGIKASNSTALFHRSAGGELTVVARTGESAPGAPGAVWKKFTSYALTSGEAGGPVVLGQLSGAGVNKKNNVGLWAADSTGTLTLLARTGQSLLVGGESKTVTKLTLLNAIPPVQGSARSFNDNRQIAYLATFSDKTQAVLSAYIP